MDVYQIDTYQLKLRVLNELVRLTSSGKLFWKKDDHDLYITEKENLKISVEFYNYQRMDEMSSDDTVLSIAISVDQNEILNAVRYDFSIGSEGFDLVVKMLSSSFPDWKETWERIAIRKSSNVLSYLKEL
jgi:hypothetical protein